MGTVEGRIDGADVGTLVVGEEGAAVSALVGRVGNCVGLTEGVVEGRRLGTLEVGAEDGTAVDEGHTIVCDTTRLSILTGAQY